jgi:uncharacterized membrane protein (UPF0127 family)
VRLILALLLLVTTACTAAAPTPASSPTTAPVAAAAPKPSPPETALAPGTTPSAGAPTAASVPTGTTGAVSPAPKPATAVPPPSSPPALIGSAATTAPGAANAGPAMPAATVVLRRADGQERQLKVEIASDDSTRARGLMFRPTMPDDAGMLFIFPGDVDAPFWMQNTLLPLSIAWIAADGRIVDIQDMQPQTTDLHQPSARYRQALEVNQGYFARNGVKVGDRAEVQRS